jgi:hypothetical protein
MFAGGFEPDVVAGMLTTPYAWFDADLAAVRTPVALSATGVGLSSTSAGTPIGALTRAGYSAALARAGTGGRDRTD